MTCDRTAALTSIKGRRDHFGPKMAQVLYLVDAQRGPHRDSQRGYRSWEKLVSPGYEWGTRLAYLASIQHADLAAESETLTGPYRPIHLAMGAFTN